jgi:hypothetical protein
MGSRGSVADSRYTSVSHDLLVYARALTMHSVMKPNTPHAVFTTKHSIVLGGHFYSFSNMQDTLMGIIHCFAVDNIVTNTEHPTTRILLFRMMQYLYKFYVKGGDPCRKSIL